MGTIIVVMLILLAAGAIAGGLTGYTNEPKL